MSNNDIYSVKGRMLNNIAMDDIPITSGGNMLVNMYTHVLMSFYSFAETNGLPQLTDLVKKAETFPRDVIKVINPAPQKTLYEQVTEAMANPEFKSTQDALAAFQSQYDAMGGDNFWAEAENADIYTEEYREIINLAKRIHMCRYLIEKEKNG